MAAATARRLDEIEVELRIVGDDNGVRGIRVEVVHPLARDSLRRPGERLDGRQMPFAIIMMRVERGHVDARHGGELLQSLPAREPLSLCLVVDIHEGRHDNLAFADDKGIKDRRERLRVERRTRTARNEDGIAFAALRGLRLDLAQSEQLQDVEVIHLERDGKAQHLKVIERRLCLHAHDWRARILIARDLRALRQEDALTGRIASLVQEVIDDVEAEIRHADEVGIGIDEGKARPRAHGIDIVSLLLLQLFLQLSFQFPIQVIILRTDPYPGQSFLISFHAVHAFHAPRYPCRARAACAAACSAALRGSSRCRQTCGKQRQSGCKRRHRSP